jgi:hypothetical protein
MYSAMYSWLDRGILRLEGRLGPRGAAGVVGLGLLGLAMLHVLPSTATSAYGNTYSRMAEDPFGHIDGNALGYRILTPLLSWLVGLRGDLILVTNDLFAVALLGCAFWHFRRTLPRPGDALLAGSCLALSMVVLSVTRGAGYCDALTYLIVFLMWRHRARPILRHGLLLLGLLNHESIAFLVPWFAYLAFVERRSTQRWLLETILGLGVVGGLYLGFRALLSSYGYIQFSASFYLRPLRYDLLYWIKKAWPNQLLGLFSVFKVLWIVPIWAAVSLWRKRQRQALAEMGILLACVCAQLVIAFDSTRMLTLAYLLLVLSLEHLFAADEHRFRRWLAIALLVQLATPELFTAERAVEIWHSTPVMLVRAALGNTPS